MHRAKRVPRLSFVGCAFCAFFCSSEPSWAEDEVSAEMLFERALTFKDAGQCDEALPLFVASHRLAPSVGSLLNIADCERDQGRHATAWHRLQQAASLAISLGDEQRADFALQRAATLEPSLSRVSIELDKPVPGITLAVDGTPWTKAQQTNNPIEPGTHQVAVEAPGHRPFRKSFSIGSADTTIWSVPALLPFNQAAPPQPMAIDETQWIAGWTGIGLGGTALLVSAGLGIGALVHNDAIDGFCPGPSACLPEAADLQRTALNLERAAIATVTAGATLAAVGVILVATTDSPQEAVTLSLGPTAIRLGAAF